MVQPLKQYPDESINVNAGPVRGFGEDYQRLVQDLIDTASAENLPALSAIQIGEPFHLFVLKDADGNYTPYANSRIIRQEKRFLSEEICHYYHHIPITVPRYEKLSATYEDANGKTCTKIIQDKTEAVLFQRMTDFCFNTALLDRLRPEQREAAIKALEGKGHMPQPDDVFCPTVSKKEYFVSLADKLLFFMALSLPTPLFNFEKSTVEHIYTFDKIAFPAVILLMIGFFFYAQYEAKKHRQCSSCQVGNNIGVMVKRIVAAVVLAAGAYFLVNPA